MKYVYIILPLLIFLIACMPTLPHVRAAHKVMDSFTKKMKKEGLYLQGSGGAMMRDIQYITLGYEIVQKMTVEEARMLFISKAEALLDQINSDENIRPYLHDYPFTSKNIFFKITFCKPNGEFVDPPYPTYVVLFNHKDQIVYNIYDHQTERLETLYEESYQDALKIYHENMMKTPLSQL